MPRKSPRLAKKKKTEEENVDEVSDEEVQALMSLSSSEDEEIKSSKKKKSTSKRKKKEKDEDALYEPDMKSPSPSSKKKKSSRSPVSKNGKSSVSDEDDYQEEQDVSDNESKKKSPKKGSKSPKATKKAKKKKLDEESAAIIIQRFYRRVLAQRRLRSIFWQFAWNQLDIEDESESAKDDAEIEKYLQRLQQRKVKYNAKARERSKEKYGSAPKKSRKKSEDTSKFVVDNSYKGPHITPTIFQSQSEAEPISSGRFQLTRTHTFSSAGITNEFVVDMIEFLSQGGVLHYKYAHQIAKEGTQVLEACENINEIPIPRDGRVTVVGDIHGQLNDLLTIFQQNGHPSSTNVYLFNGDFVDRGPNSVEVFLILYALKVLYPNYIFLNRGNHEQKRLNERYGFGDECREKYDNEMFDIMADSFRFLPLCSIIAGKVFVLHGGLFSTKNVTLDKLRKIDRTKDLPPSDERVGDFKIIEEILWSDPKPDLKGTEPSSRGSGVHFGKDVTKNFLKKNGLELIIRSHEKESEGFITTHDGLLITLFSASRYCGSNDNQGAYAVFLPNAPTKPSFHSFTADSFKDTEAKLNFEQQCLTQTMQKLREKIYYNRHELLYCFTSLDHDKDGKITRVEWGNAMSSVLRITLPWLKIQPYLATTDIRGHIEYVRFLDRYKIKLKSDFTAKWTMSAIESICAKIFEKSADLEAEFKSLDKNGSGELDYVEFVDALKKYDVGLSHQQMYDLMRMMDKDNNNRIDLQEFISAFEVKFNQLKGEQEKQQEWLVDAVADVGKRLLKKKSKLEQAFKLFDKQEAGNITYYQFAEVCKKLGVNYTEDQLHDIAGYIDTDNSGTISFKEFRKAFEVSNSKLTEGWKDAAMEKICELFHKNRLQLKAAFQFFDTDGSGVVDLEEFTEGLEELEVMEDYPLTDEQIEELFNAIDIDGNGEIEYKEFLKSFSIVDTSLEEGDEKTPKGKKKAAPKSPKAARSKSPARKRKTEEEEEEVITKKKKVTKSPTTKRKGRK